MASLIAFDGARQRPWPAWLVLGLLLAACVWLAVRLLATLLSGAGSDGAAPDDGAAGAGLAPAAPLESLSGWHLFGNALVAGDPSLRAASAPQTGEALVLVGVLAGTDPAAGVALVADASGGQRAYRVGAELPGGSRLRAVLPDRILLERNGVEEALALLRPQGAAPGPAPAGADPAAGLDRMPALLGVVPQAGVAAGGEVDWQAVQRQIAVDPAELARQVQVLPVFENGEMAGVRLSGGAAAPLVERLGLRPDDIVTAVNGIDVRDPARAQEILASVRDAGRVSVTLRRDGNTQTLNVDLK